MKSIKLLLALFFVTSLFTSCTVVNNDLVDDSISLEQVVSDYDLWYIDYNRTTGNGDVPFISKAFTLSFYRGTLYANNNIVDIGHTGNGLGIVVGNYNTRNGYLETVHDIDGRYDFDVVLLSNNEIRIDDLDQNVSYYLVGYDVGDFDYQQLFNDNIEYFIQEYIAWEKVETEGGTSNAIDDENFLQFTPENNTTFYSSHDENGTNIDDLQWDFVGSYVIRDFNGRDDIKDLTLNYQNGDTEDFKLSVVNHGEIRLFHYDSETTYNFVGKGFIQYRRGGDNSAKNIVRNSGRKRTKVIREKTNRKH